MSDSRVKIYVSYELPGSFFPEHDEREVPDRNPQRELAEAPRNAFAFIYYDVAALTSIVNGREITAKSQPMDRSKRYLIGAELVDQDAVRAMGPDKAILLSNMEGNRWSHVVRFHTGNFQSYDPNRDVILSHG